MNNKEDEMGITIIQNGKRYSQVEFLEMKRYNANYLSNCLSQATCVDDLNAVIRDAEKIGLHLRNQKNTVVKRVEEDITGTRPIPYVFYYVDRPRSSRRPIALDTITMNFTIS